MWYGWRKFLAFFKTLRDFVFFIRKSDLYTLKKTEKGMCEVTSYWNKTKVSKTFMSLSSETHLNL